jgi:hypothetical protein
VCLSFCFDSEQSWAWAGRGGPWAASPPWWIVFAVKMEYPVLLVPDIRLDLDCSGEDVVKVHALNGVL